MYRAETAADQRGSWSRCSHRRAEISDSHGQQAPVLASRGRQAHFPEVDHLRRYPGWLKREYALLGNMQISHEAINRTPSSRHACTGNKEFMRIADVKDDAAIQEAQAPAISREADIVDAVSIRRAACQTRGPRSSRPLGVRRFRSGRTTRHRHLVERRLGHDAARSMLGKTLDTVVRALISQLLKRLHNALGRYRLSLSWDRGMELARHKEFSIATDVEGISAITSESLATAQMRTRIETSSTVLPEEDRSVAMRQADSEQSRSSPQRTSKRGRSLGFAVIGTSA